MSVQINIDEVRDQLRLYLQETKKSQAVVAKSLGVSAAVISQFLNGIYPGGNEQLAYSIKQMLDVETRRRQNVQVPDFVMTGVAKEVLAITGYAHDHTDIGVVHGPAGIGKTKALLHYVHKNPGTVYVTADVTISGSKAILEEILDKLGRSEYGDRRRLRRSIVNILKGSGRIIIIDEAQHLSLKALETLRSLYDECNIGLVLCGNDQIYANMIGKYNAPFAQLFSRVGIRRSLSNRVSAEDVKQIICQVDTIPAECLDYFKRVANTHGGIRLMVKLFVLAGEIANRINEPISLEIITNAQDFLMQHS